MLMKLKWGPLVPSTFVAMVHAHINIRNRKIDMLTLCRDPQIDFAMLLRKGAQTMNKPLGREVPRGTHGEHMWHARAAQIGRRCGQPVQAFADIGQLAFPGRSPD
tara:strand:+ start:1653 stop:1967 length:315 start_codon:yes stop_codon:yes gene_type:complete